MPPTSTTTKNNTCFTTDLDEACQQLIEAEFGSHFLFTYPDVNLWKKLYCTTVKKYLKEDDSFVLIIPFYETAESVRKTLAAHIPNIIKYEKEDGSLAIIDSIKAYFSEIGIMTFANDLLKHAKSMGKSGLSVFADMGSFHYMNKIHRLVEHEISLPKKYDAKLRGFCFYHEGNFEKLTEQQKQSMYEHHEKNIFIK
jgi:hypothetical protein